MGEAKDIILNRLGRLTETYTATSLEDAVNFAYQTAKQGDKVLLSQACSSFDMFKSYAERGENFRAHVNEIKEMYSKP